MKFSEAIDAFIADWRRELRIEKCRKITSPLESESQVSIVRVLRHRRC